MTKNKNLLSSILIRFITAFLIICYFSFPVTIKASAESKPIDEINNVSVLDANIKENTSEKSSTKKNKVRTSEGTEIEVTQESYSKFKESLNKKEIDSVYINFIDEYSPTLDEKYKKFFYTIKNDSSIYQTDNPSYKNFRQELLDNDVHIFEEKEINNIIADITVLDMINNLLNILLVISIILMLLRLIFNYIKKSSQRPTFGIEVVNKKSSITTKDCDIKSFSDVAGLTEVKNDMLSLVDFLKNSDKYTAKGAKLPRGVILYGPPGTGKTLLAKAVAGEAGVPFFYMSGSQFVEMYVGVGAKRVRELFNKAKQNAPCIIFIDEIDAIGKKRNGNSGNDEKDQTLNQLLVELDGFKKNDNIIVIGATNRLDSLDSALLRPGRFTRKFCVPLPETPEERKEIINLYAKDKYFSSDVDFDSLAKQTIGCSPADIENILNESAILSVRENMEFINRDIIEKAMFTIDMQGHAKTSKKRKSEENKLIAYHEAGHALIGKLLEMDVTKVTIQGSYSGAGGVTWTVPEKIGLLSIEELKNEVKQLYAGRLAEYLLYNDWQKTTTGASNDIEKATEIIYGMISVYGMNDNYGMINLNKLNIDNKEILQEEIRLSNQIKEETLSLMKKHKNKLDEIALLLLEKETIYGDDLNEIFTIKQ